MIKRKNFTVYLFLACFLCMNKCQKAYKSCDVTTTCIILEECKLYYNALINVQSKEMETYIQNFKLKPLICGLEGNSEKICCPISELYLEVTAPPINITNHQNLKLLPNKCGSIDRFSIRIHGGTESKWSIHRWMVMLIMVDKEDNFYFICGGTIISKRYILTSAHCVDLPEETQKQLQIRGNNNDDNDSDSDFQDFFVEKIIMHPGYNWANIQNDVALLRLHKSIEFNENLEAICLPINEELMYAPLGDSNATATGWGLTDDDTVPSNIMQIEIPIIDNGKCRKVYKGIYNLNYKQMCAGQRGKHMCHGDSGGPLIIKKKSKYVQYGIISGGNKNCTISNYLNIFTRIPYYMKWILDEIEP